MSIAILCPTRNRPEKLARMIKSAGGNRVYVGFSDIERDIQNQDLTKVIVGQFPDNLPTSQKWNDMALAAKNYTDARLFMLGADDMYFETPGWDKALLDHYNSLENKIHAYALQDSRDPDGTPHPIVSREWIDALGYFVPPIFLHWFVDSWTVNIAKANGVFTHFKQFRLVHDKPSDRGEADETHSRIREWGWHERDKFVNDTCQHFLECEKSRLASEIYKRTKHCVFG